jgi:hypothetical protein
MAPGSTNTALLTPKKIGRAWHALISWGNARFAIIALYDMHLRNGSQFYQARCGRTVASEAQPSIRMEMVDIQTKATVSYNPWRAQHGIALTTGMRWASSEMRCHLSCSVSWYLEDGHVHRTVLRLKPKHRRAAWTSRSKSVFRTNRYISIHRFEISSQTNTIPL